MEWGRKARRITILLQFIFNSICFQLGRVWGVGGMGGMGGGKDRYSCPTKVSLSLSSMTGTMKPLLRRTFFSPAIKNWSPLASSPLPLPTTRLPGFQIGDSCKGFPLRNTILLFPDKVVKCDKNRYRATMVTSEPSERTSY